MSCSYVIIFVAHCILFRAVTACPSGCYCGQDGVVACTQLPPSSAIPTNTKTLSLYNFAIDNIPSKTFTDLTSLQELTLYAMAIESIGSLSFYGLHNLTSLSIYNCNIGTIDSYAFYDLNYISSLTIYSSVIGNIKPKAFHNINDIGTLSLNNLNITRISSHSFSGLYNVNRMTLYSNYIELIQPCAFRNLSVTSFDMYNCTIDTIGGYGFSDIEADHFSFYNLNMDMFSSHAIYNISNAISMSFYGNVIGTFSERAIVGLRGIQTLDIYSNDFQTYECWALDEVSAGVQVFSFYSNRLYCDCRNAWLYSANALLYWPPTICYGPGNFTGRRVRDVTTDELGCPRKGSICAVISSPAKCLTEEYTTPSLGTTPSPNQSVINHPHTILLTSLYLVALSLACYKSIV